MGAFPGCCGICFIPNDDFVPGAALNTDTSAIPDFTIWAGSGGVIAIEWIPVKGVFYPSMPSSPAAPARIACSPCGPL